MSTMLSVFIKNKEIKAIGKIVVYPGKEEVCTLAMELPQLDMTLHFCNRVGLVDFCEHHNFPLEIKNNQQAA